MDNHLPQTTTTPTGWAMLLIEDSGLAPSFRVVVQSSSGDYCASILQDADGTSVKLDCRRIYWPQGYVAGDLDQGA